MSTITTLTIVLELCVCGYATRRKPQDELVLTKLLINTIKCMSFVNLDFVMIVVAFQK